MTGLGHGDEEAIKKTVVRSTMTRNAKGDRQVSDEAEETGFTFL